MKMPTFSDDKIAFVHIFKTGGSSITKWYEQHVNINILNKHYNHYCLSVVENPASISFTVIRNPWDRVVSMYFNICRNFPNFDIIFDNYVLYDMKTTLVGGKPLSTPQIRWSEQVTHVLRFENIDKDFKIIQDIFQCYEPLYKPTQINHDHYRTYYNDETRRAVAEMFKEDIEAFGYEF